MTSLEHCGVFQVSALQMRFDLERENSRVFKDNVKKQFEERQSQVCGVVTKLPCFRASV